MKILTIKEEQGLSLIRASLERARVRGDDVIEWESPFLLDIIDRLTMMLDEVKFLK